MIVRLLKSWRYRKVGTVLKEVPDGAANILIRRGIAERFEEVKAEQKQEPVRGKRVRA